MRVTQRNPTMIETIRMDLQVLETAANAGDLATARRSVDATEAMFVGLRAALCGRGLDVGSGPSWATPPATATPATPAAPAPAPAAPAPAPAAPAPAPAALTPALFIPRPARIPWGVAAEARLWSGKVWWHLLWALLRCSAALAWRVVR